MDSAYAIPSGLLAGLMIIDGGGIGAIFISFAIPLLAAACFGWLASKKQTRDSCRERTPKTVSTNDIKTPEVTEESWTGAFAAKTEEAFGEAFAEDVVLEAAALLVPVQGRTDVKTVMTAASNYYSSLKFLHQATNGPRTYIEWESTGASGVQFKGITILTRNEEGLIEHVAISHRPLAAILEFSDAMNTRTLGKIKSGHFRPNA